MHPCADNLGVFSRGCVGVTTHSFVFFCTLHGSLCVVVCELRTTQAGSCVALFFLACNNPRPPTTTTIINNSNNNIIVNNSTMSDTYGGSIILGNLDDFIAPSQACVNPIFTQPKAGAGGGPGGSMATPNSDEPAARHIVIETDDALLAPPPIVQPDLIKTVGGAGTAARVSLSDCLACSGCVTSAETVLVQNHSSDRSVSYTHLTLPTIYSV